MELALSIALIIGIILFMLGFFIVIWGGFKHHFVTGIIAMIPVVNFIILPSVWHRSYIGFYLSIIGALITLGAWYGGGEQYISTQANKYGISVPFSSTIKATEEGDSITSAQVNIAPATEEESSQPQQQAVIEKAETAEQETFEPVGDLLSLPQQPLYLLVFESIEVENAASLQGEHVRIEKKDGNITEGKVTKSSNKSLFIEHNGGSAIIAFEVKTDSISTLEKLVKRNN